MIKSLRNTTLLVILFSSLFMATGAQPTTEPVVRAVLFVSPTCGFCRIAATEVLPSLAEEYGDQLQIVMIYVYHHAGQQLYRETVSRFQLPEERQGVPTLVVGDVTLVGSGEIPEQFPGHEQQPTYRHVPVQRRHCQAAHCRVVWCSRFLAGIYGVEHIDRV